MALSTLKPATSPGLSAIKLYFGCLITRRYFGRAIGVWGNDLRWVADEIARIKREFKGTVDVSVVWDTGFTTFDTLDVSFIPVERG